MQVAENIKQKLEKAFNPLALEVVDESHKHAGHAGARAEGNSHFAVYITSEQFRGIPRVHRHKFIYKVLDNELKNGVHALSICALTPEEN